MATSESPLWEPQFFRTQPAFEVFDEAVRETLSTYSSFPKVSEYAKLKALIAGAEAFSYGFCEQVTELVREHGGYDAFIRSTSHIPTRPNSAHDLLNALIWLHFPRVKQALHKQLADARETPRTAFQNAAAHFDESGVIVLSNDPDVFCAIAELRWRELFWEERHHTQETTRFLTFGHGLLDALRHPFVGLTGKALFVALPDTLIDASTSELRRFVDDTLRLELRERLAQPSCLSPLPVLGIPGWHVAQTEEFYADAQYFRVSRTSKRGTT